MTDEYAIGILEDLRDSILEDHGIPKVVKEDVRLALNYGIGSIKGIELGTSKKDYFMELLKALRALCNRSFDKEFSDEIDAAIQKALVRMVGKDFDLGVNKV